MKLKEAIVFEENFKPNFTIFVAKSPDGQWTATLEQVDDKDPRASKVEAYGVKLIQKGRSGHEALQLMATNFNKAGFME